MGKLWELTVDELREETSRLSQELSKLRAFVADQEEELSLQLQEVETMRQKMEELSEYERLTVQSELEEEEQHYQLLNETLKGQRQSLMDRANILETHEKVLEQRTAAGQEAANSNLPNLSPALKKFKDHCQSHRTMLAEVEVQVQELSNNLENQRAGYNDLVDNVRILKSNLADQEKSLNQQKLDLGICQGKVEVYQAFLHPMEEQLSNLRSLVAETEEGGDRAPIITELKQTLMTLGETPEAVSI